MLIIYLGDLIALTAVLAKLFHAYALDFTPASVGRLEAAYLAVGGVAFQWTP